MKPLKYVPHRKLTTKRSDSEDKDYNRAQNREVIDEQLDDSDFYLNQEGERESVEDMYEHGFHIEQPED